MIRLNLKQNRLPRQTPQSSERFERKFYLPSHVVPFAAHLLSHACPADRQYPRGTIHSVYYDTDTLDCYEESEQGNHTRRKIRIRWYDDAADSEESVPVFVELKSKNGFAGSKQRKRCTINAGRLNPPLLRQGVLPYPQFEGILAEFDFFPRSMLHPVILVSYQRLRFVDPLSGSRISLDWNIRSTLVSPLYDRREGCLRMDGAVIEIKGQSRDIPLTLHSIRCLRTDWSRYSKYASCLQSQMEQSGSVGRLMPSGRTEKY